MDNTHSIKNIRIVTRLNATLPAALGQFVGEITGEGGLYETPSEFVRDLIRRYMEGTKHGQEQEINALLLQSVSENNYSPWTKQDIKNVRDTIEIEP